jgi:hypothetical protein
LVVAAGREYRRYEGQDGQREDSREGDLERVGKPALARGGWQGVLKDHREDGGITTTTNTVL